MSKLKLMTLQIKRNLGMLFILYLKLVRTQFFIALNRVAGIGGASREAEAYNAFIFKIISEKLINGTKFENCFD